MRSVPALGPIGHSICTAHGTVYMTPYQKVPRACAGTCVHCIQASAKCLKQGRHLQNTSQQCARHARSHVFCRMVFGHGFGLSRTTRELVAGLVPGGASLRLL